MMLRSTVPGFPKYSVDELGRITGPKGVLKPRKDARGYLCVDLYREGQRKTMKVHGVVMLALVHPTPNGYHIDHIDLDTTNNRLSNLRFRESTENSGARRSNNVPRRTVDAELRYAVQELNSKGDWSVAALGRVFKLNEKTVRKIITGAIQHAPF